MLRRVIGTPVAVLFLIPTAPLSAQTTAAKHPDFSGTWRVTAIEAPDTPGAGGDRGFGGGGRGGGGRGFGGGRGGRGFGGGGGRRGAQDGGSDPDGAAAGRAERVPRLEQGQTIRIRQTDERLIVTEQGDAASVMNSYSLDGHETTNSGDGATTKSKSKWEGVAIVTDSTRVMATPQGKFELKTREIRSLSDDGQTMTVRTTRDTPRGKQTMTVTFAKVDG